MSVLESLIGWLSPPDCINCGAESSTLCAPCLTSEIVPYGEHCWNCGAVSRQAKTCDKCRRASSPRFVWITTYYEATPRSLIRKYKFGQQRVAAISLAGLMAKTFLAYSSVKDRQDQQYLVVPIPTATSRVRQRGFDHSALLAKKLAQKLSLESCNGLGRLGQSSQVGALRAQRLTQPAESYYVKSARRVRGRNILLIDDVLTTGATLQAATRVLREAGVRHVDALVFAKRL